MSNKTAKPTGHQKGMAVKGDRALKAGDEDRLGFRDLAANLATSLADHASNEGFVFGVEGPWGSGKSSLLYLIEEELKNLPEGKACSVVNFRPWLIGNRDALLANLFSSLTAEIDVVALRAGDASKISVSKAKEAADALRKFVSALGKAGAAVQVAGDLIGFAPASWVGKGLSAAGELSSHEPGEPSLEELKDSLVKSLRELEHRFVVTVDDVDRLEPKEVLEVLRLIRSVADFPNVTYLLCYDIGILAHSIEKAAEVQDGRAYLEKIVQLTATVPKPETFHLRQWFSGELDKLASARDQDELSRLKEVIDYEGGRQLKTPRSVVRTLDALRFVLPSLHEAGIDLADLIWLLLIKEGNPPLYRWIENYCNTAASISLGTARVDEAEKATTLSALKSAVDPGSFEDRVYLFSFVDHIPGAEVELSNDDYDIGLYQEISVSDRDTAISNGRLKSPDHYKFYFALSKPSHALSRRESEGIQRATVKGAEETRTQLLSLTSENATNSLTKADIFLERLRGGPPGSWDIGQVRNLLLALANMMDEPLKNSSLGSSSLNSIWDRAERTIQALLARMGSRDRQSTLDEMFRDGRAIGWLTALLRREIWAHGRFGDRRRHEQSWYFSDSELDRIIKRMLKRYRALTPSAVFALIDPLNLFCAWLEAGDEGGPRRLMARCTRTNQGLIDSLERLTSQTVSTSGRYDVLARASLEPFLDYAKARRRIEALQRNQDRALAARAEALAHAFKKARR